MKAARTIVSVVAILLGASACTLDSTASNAGTDTNAGPEPNSTERIRLDAPIQLMGPEVDLEMGTWLNVPDTATVVYVATPSFDCDLAQPDCLMPDATVSAIDTRGERWTVTEATGATQIDLLPDRERIVVGDRPDGGRIRVASIDGDDITLVATDTRPLTIVTVAEDHVVYVKGSQRVSMFGATLSTGEIVRLASGARRIDVVGTSNGRLVFVEETVPDDNGELRISLQSVPLRGGDVDVLFELAGTKRRQPSISPAEIVDDTVVFTAATFDGDLHLVVPVAGGEVRQRPQPAVDARPDGMPDAGSIPGPWEWEPRVVAVTDDGRWLVKGSLVDEPTYEYVTEALGPLSQPPPDDVAATTTTFAPRTRLAHTTHLYRYDSTSGDLVRVSGEPGRHRASTGMGTFASPDAIIGVHLLGDGDHVVYTTGFVGAAYSFEYRLYLASIP